jgi:hypothetical protein
MYKEKSEIELDEPNLLFYETLYSYAAKTKVRKAR